MDMLLCTNTSKCGCIIMPWIWSISVSTYCVHVGNDSCVCAYNSQIIGISASRPDFTTRCLNMLIRKKFLYRFIVAVDQLVNIYRYYDNFQMHW